MDVRPLTRESPGFNIADPVFRRAFLVFRWFLLIAYVALVGFGVLDVSTRALLLSSALIAACDVFHTVIEFAYQGSDRRVYAAARYLDVCTITVALVAIHDVRNPVWAIYLMTVVGAAQTLTRKAMALNVGWVMANYVAFAFISAGIGHPVSWPYVAGVASCIGFMGLTSPSWQAASSGFVTL
ncbi:MAG: hypothetical protein M3P30_02425 [Chloroflexota bacterium]|nr:hypothetical protein [Chloroflexota bacterium]